MEEPMYRVCPHRNVPAAFQPFLGADSGGIERFFDNAVEREVFCGRRWHHGMAAFASERADAVVAVYAALRPLAIALWIRAHQLLQAPEMKGPARGGAGARFNGRRLVGASCIRGSAAASPQLGPGIPTLPGIPVLLPMPAALANSVQI